MILELADTWHHGVISGDVPAVIVVFYAGIMSMPVTVKKPADPLAGN